MWTMNFHILKVDLENQRNQRSNCHICWIIEKASSRKHLFLLYWLCQSLCVDHNKLWKILKEMGIADHLSCFLRNLYAGQKATVRTGQWIVRFHVGKGVCQGCISSPCLFNLHTECFMRNAGLDKTQAGIQIAGKISITSDMQMTPHLWQRVTN